MKKLASMLMAVIMIFCTFSTSALAIDSFDYDKAYEWAINVGIPEKNLQIMDAEHLWNMYYDAMESDSVEVYTEYYHPENNGLLRGNID